MDRTDPRRRYLQLLASGAATALAGCAALGSPGSEPTPGPETTEPNTGKIDDWQYDPASASDPGATHTPAPQATLAQAASAGSSGGSATVGLAAGGAKDIATFRRNVEEGYLPQPESLSYEGLFYNYHFETDGGGDCSSLFCPSYAPAVTADPLSGETERYLTVGLDSGLAASEFERKRLNLVVVLDVSGSMGESFSEYYYDRFGNRHSPDGDTDTPKIQVARDALVSLTEQLRPGDRFGVVLYSSDSAVAKPLRPVEATDMDAIRGHIREDVQAGGGTNLSAGLSDATELLSEYSDADQSTYENRMVVLTDAMPNLGTTDDGSLRDRLAENAASNVHATFVGVGVDFNAELVDELTAIRGANYYGVHSADEFERRLGEEFQYMVTPLVFDLSLELDAEGYALKQVYGSSAAGDGDDRRVTASASENRPNSAEIMHVNTLFASPKNDKGKTRGGVVLAQIEREAADPSVTLRASWEGRQGTQRATTATIQFPDESPESFATTGVRKAVLLSRYADLVKNWLVAEREPTAVPTEDGIAVPPDGAALGEWEQQSKPLTVSDRYRERIRTFAAYFEREADAIGDESLSRERETMARILEQSS